MKRYLYYDFRSNSRSNTQAKTHNTESNKELSRLREWCTEPKIKDVFGRHKFTVLHTDTNADDTHWKEIIKGGHSFYKDGKAINPEKIKHYLCRGNEKNSWREWWWFGCISKEPSDEQISVLKNACKAVLDAAFTRDNFYLIAQFINNMTEATKPTIDPFQETFFFCVQPTTASDHTTKVLQGGIIDSNFSLPE